MVFSVVVNARVASSCAVCRSLLGPQSAYRHRDYPACWTCARRSPQMQKRRYSTVDHLHAHVHNMVEYDGVVEGYEEYDSAEEDPDFWKL